MSTSIKLLKLVSGDEVLSEISEVGSVVHLINPVKIVVVPTKNDPRTPQVGFAPWAQFTADTKFTVDKSHILAIMSPIAEMITQYKSIFSPIIQKSSGLLVPSGV